ncbi:hypothetical protein A6R68_15925, partial [Neotoma lepida]
MSRCKTSIRRGQPNPVYKETFVFQVALFQLSDVTLMISIYSRRTMKRKEMIGWIALGQNSSGEEEQEHWEEMKESKGQQICRRQPYRVPKGIKLRIEFHGLIFPSSKSLNCSNLRIRTGTQWETVPEPKNPAQLSSHL